MPRMTRNTFGDVCVTMFAVLMYVLCLHVIGNKLGPNVSPYTPLLLARAITGAIMLLVWGVIAALRRGRKP